jgi:hypothetical protein
MLTSHEIVGFMSPTLATEILTWAHQDDKPLYKAMLAAVAQARKVRPIFMERQPRPERHTAMLATLARPSMENNASTLIRTWLLKKHKVLLVDFLDALGVQHEDGVVDDLPPAMEDDKLRAGVEALLAKHPHEIVSVYLNAFNGMNETNWPLLQQMLREEPRLQLGASA